MTQEEKENTAPISDVSTSGVASKPTKRKRLLTPLGLGQKPNPKRQRKVRRSLETVPIEIAFAIFQYLTPDDLLSISRTSKAFRATLFNREHKAVWIRCLDNVVPLLPPCPPNMSEPAYSALVFNKFCHFCGKGRVDRVDMVCRLRACKQCLANEQHFVALGEYMPSPIYMAQYKVHEILPAIVVPSKRSGREPVAYVPQEAWDAYNEQEYASTRAADDITDNKLDALYEEFVLQRFHEMQPLQEHASLFEAYLEEKKKLRDKAANRVRDRRLEQILERLDLIGGGLKEEVDLMDTPTREAFDAVASTRQPVLLSDIAWERMKDDVVQYLEQARLYRIRQERARPYGVALNHLIADLDARAKVSPFEADRAPLADICLHPAMQANFFSPAVAQVIGRGPLPAVHNYSLLLAMSEWREVVRHTLMDIAAQGISDLFGIHKNELTGLNVLSLACARFTCLRCQCRAMGLRHAYEHECLRRNHDVRENPQSPEDDLVNALAEKVYNSARAHPDRIKALLAIDERACDNLQQVLQLCDLDILRTTPNVIDSLHCRVACTGCEIIMTWRKAVLHECEQRVCLTPLGEEPPEQEQETTPRPLQLVHENVAWHVKDIEKRPRVNANGFTPLFCVYCRPWDHAQYQVINGAWKMRLHLWEVHRIDRDKAIVGTDYTPLRGEHMWNVARHEPEPVSFAAFSDEHDLHPLSPLTSTMTSSHALIKHRWDRQYIPQPVRTSG